MHKEFLQKRKKQEEDHFSEFRNAKSNILNSLVVIEINLTELCNRKCAFCPRVDPKVFPNRNLHMNLDLSSKISSNLNKINYKGRLSFSGFGEPLLAKNLMEHIKIYRKNLKNNNFEINTNGDKLDSQKIVELFNVGLTNLYINAYDGSHQIKIFEKMISDSKIDRKNFFIRPHWESYNEKWGLFLNNRSGMVVSQENKYLKPLEASLPRKCYYPFYKMFIDFNGTVLFCSNDWGRINIVGDTNKEKIEDIWMGAKLNYFRKKLAKKDRSSKPCNTCSINGTMHGEESFNLLKDYLKLKN